MSNIVFDDSRWPLLVVRYLSTSFTDQEWQDHFEKILEYNQRPERYVFVTDLAKDTKQTATQRKYGADMLRDKKNQFSEKVIAGALVIRSQVTRAVTTGMVWLMGGFPYPHKSFGNYADAEAWALQQLSTVYPASPTAHSKGTTDSKQL